MVISHSIKFTAALTLVAGLLLGACSGGGGQSADLNSTVISRSVPTESKTPTPPNNPPVISGVPPTSAVAHQPYSFQPAATDADGNPLTFSISNKPTWASFDTQSGTLSGVPGPTDVGTTSNIAITASDGHATSALPTFSISVEQAPSTPGTPGTPVTPGTPNTSPTISGTSPASARVGEAYSFQPITADADNDQLTFSIVNKPDWATFDETTGQISGTPGAAGTFAGIGISVSDGKLSAALAPFTIVVNGGASSGTATLSWQAPTQNTDGSALTNLAGYNIYYGKSASALTQVINIRTVGIVTYVITNLGSGNWYFAMTAVNSAGVESARSSAVGKTIT